MVDKNEVNMGTNNIEMIQSLRHALICATDDAIQHRDCCNHDENRGQFLALVNHTLDESESLRTDYENQPRWRKEHLKRHYYPGR
jgi:hypothetical protein